MGHRAVRHHHRLAGRSAPLARSAGRDLRRSVFLPDHVAVFLARAVGDQHDDPKRDHPRPRLPAHPALTRQRVLVRCARSVALVGSIWLIVAVLFDTTMGLFHLDRLELDHAPSFWMDVRYYIGWAIGLALAPSPYPHQSATSPTPVVPPSHP